MRTGFLTSRASEVLPHEVLPREGPHCEGPSDEAGYTLVEVVVATALTVIVAGLVVASFLFAAGAVARWQRGLDLENTTHALRTRIATDLRRAERVGLPRADSLVLWTGPATPPVAYAVRDSALYRGEIAAHGEGLRLHAFSVELIGEGGEALAAAEADSAAVVAVTVALSDGRRVEERRAVAVRRTPLPWAPAPR